MKMTPAGIPGVLIIEAQVYRDSRGFFIEGYNRREWARHGFTQEFVQDNMSHSRRGTLRGLHYQLAPHAQGKLVRVLRGEVFDVCVDLRTGSPAFGRWLGETLTGENGRALYVPPGFAHGFCVLSEEAEFYYKCTGYYEPTAERSIAWNDPEIGIQWPLIPDPQAMSAKDKNAPCLRDAEINFDAKLL